MSMGLKERGEAAVMEIDAQKRNCGEDCVTGAQGRNQGFKYMIPKISCTPTSLWPNQMPENKEPTDLSNIAHT